MTGQRSGLLRGTLALLLCAILLSTVLSTLAYADKDDPSGREPLRGPVFTPGEGGLGDGSGAGDPPTEGDPDDYDFVVVIIPVSWVGSALILIY